MTARVELRLEGDADQLRIVWQTGEALLESVTFEEDPEGSRYNVLVAVQEMLTNVIRHGYEGNDSLPVVVVFEVDQGGVTVEIRDRGPAFDPTQRCPPIRECADYDENRPLPTGGYGILISQVVMDDLAYRRDAGWNVLVMTKAASASSLAGRRP